MISTAIQRGNSVTVYNERGGVIFVKNGELQGYTSTNVSIKWGNTVTVYNERGGVMLVKNSN